MKHSKMNDMFRSPLTAEDAFEVNLGQVDCYRCKPDPSVMLVKEPSGQWAWVGSRRFFDNRKTIGDLRRNASCEPSD